MFIELHILQNFAPSNLNRDDTGSPKDCEFGGYRRARISSQCLKRAIRTEFRDAQLLPDDALAYRTKRVHEAVAEQLATRYGRDRAAAESAVQSLLRALGIAFDKGKSQYLLYVGQQEIVAVADLVQQHWERLVGGDGDQPSQASGRGQKKAAAADMAQFAPALRTALSGGKAADIALFGRMIADAPDRNIDAASQVAHAISTHQVSNEFDFYTAVDDRRPEDTEGADMLGTVEFNSACFYRYANVDLGQLARNLGGDVDLAQQTLDAFIRASVAAVPTGKQHSMAAHNPPSLVFAVARARGLWSLANAFLQPIRPARDSSGDLVGQSARAMDTYWHQLVTMYGRRGIAGSWLAALDGGDRLEHMSPAPQADIESLVKGVLDTVSFAAA